jgi:hypothetical protein
VADQWLLLLMSLWFAAAMKITGSRGRSASETGDEEGGGVTAARYALVAFDLCSLQL